MYVPPGLITWGGTRPRPTKSVALYAWLSQDSVRRKQIKFGSAILTIEFFNNDEPSLSVIIGGLASGLLVFPIIFGWLPIVNLGKPHWEGSSFWN